MGSYGSLVVLDEIEKEKGESLVSFVLILCDKTVRTLSIGGPSCTRYYLKYLNEENPMDDGTWTYT